MNLTNQIGKGNAVGPDSLDLLPPLTYAPGAMRGKLLIVLTLALWAWVFPIAHSMPTDADGPSGLSDNADFDDLILSFTSPTAAVAPMSVVIAPCPIAIDAVVLWEASSLRSVVRLSAEIRAPPLA